MKQLLTEWENYIGKLRPTTDVSNLDRVQAVADRLSLRFNDKQVLTIGGTNGKGSTALYAEALLLSKNVEVGTTTSPHLFRFNERIRINGKTIADDQLLTQFKKVDAARGDTPLTYFEFATLIALNAFNEADVDALVLEVGLGGRLDATNIVNANVCAITNIALDHQALLGSDREQIGFEKAGILRPATPLVYGESDIPLSVLNKVIELGVPMRQSPRDFGWIRTSASCWQLEFFGRDGKESYRFNHLPQQRIDFAIATQAIAVLGYTLSQEVFDRVADTRLPGKFEVKKTAQRTWIFDVAHNPAALSYAKTRLLEEYPAGVNAILFASKSDKDFIGMHSVLDSLEAKITFTSTDSDRALTGNELAAHLGCPSSDAIDEATTALAHLLHETQPGDVIFVVGSHDLVARVQYALR